MRRGTKTMVALLAALAAAGCGDVGPFADPEECDPGACSAEPDERACPGGGSVPTTGRCVLLPDGTCGREFPACAG